MARRLRLCIADGHLSSGDNLPGLRNSLRCSLPCGPPVRLPPTPECRRCDAVLDRLSPVIFTQACYPKVKWFAKDRACARPLRRFSRDSGVFKSNRINSRPVRFRDLRGQERRGAICGDFRSLRYWRRPLIGEAGDALRDFRPSRSGACGSDRRKAQPLSHRATSQPGDPRITRDPRATLSGRCA